jgi:CRISPR/Cas system-associated exonuclease Cas4 (RecB family)
VKHLKSSEIAQYLWCPYALELARRGIVAPAAQELFAQGAAVHERISEKVHAGAVIQEQRLGWSVVLAVILALIALLIYILLKGLS